MSLFTRCLLCTDISTKILYVFLVFIDLWFLVIILSIFRTKQKSVKQVLVRTGGGAWWLAIVSDAGAAPGGLAKEEAK
jgi:hypothetical protein